MALYQLLRLKNVKLYKLNREFPVFKNLIGIYMTAVRKYNISSLRLAGF
jgi:hypothetical protein